MRKFLILFAILAYGGMAAYSISRMNGGRVSGAAVESFTATSMKLGSANPVALAEFYNQALRATLAPGDERQQVFQGEVLEHSLQIVATGKRINKPQLLKFTVTDFADTLDQLLAAGVSVQRVKSPTRKALTLKDPDGNVVEITAMK